MEPPKGPSADELRLLMAAEWPGNKTFDGKPFGRGQCGACGLLARRSIDPAHPIAEEVMLADRAEGQFFFLANGSPSVPWCLVHAADLVAETQADFDRLVERTASAPNRVPAASVVDSRERRRTQGPYISYREGSALMVIHRQRDCPEWFPYREFQSPAEHRAERDMLKIEEDRKALHVRLAQMEQTARTEAGRSERKWTLLFGMFAILSVLAQLFYPNGIDFPRTIEWLASLLPWT